MTSMYTGPGAKQPVYEWKGCRCEVKRRRLLANRRRLTAIHRQLLATRCADKTGQGWNKEHGSETRLYE